MIKRELRNEGDVKAVVKAAIKREGWFFWMPAANAFGKSGQADILALRDGVLMAIETKFGHNKLTGAQRLFLRAVHTHGGLALVVSNHNLEEFITFLESGMHNIGTLQKAFLQ